MAEGLTIEQKKMVFRDHLLEMVRMAPELVAATNRFGVSMGPEVPDLKSARNTPAVARANQAFKAAEAEVGTVQTTVGFVLGILETLQIPI